MAIEQYMDGPTATDSLLKSTFMFPEEFIGFQGHFPTNKVLPGACQIQCVLSTIEKSLDRRVALKEIMLAKYITPVFPEDTVICTVSGIEDTDSDFVYKASISKDSKKVTDLKLRVRIGDKI
jgi:3-hydroxyacyl-[acyl-carrier-protein] dehydratase